MKEKPKDLVWRSPLYKNGGSVKAIIPSEMLRIKNIEDESELIFTYNLKTGKLTIEVVEIESGKSKSAE